MTEQERNDLQLTITHALKEMEQEAGDRFDIQKINLADLGRRTGISRKRLRNIQKNGFVVKPHALRGTRKEKTVLSGFTGIIDAQLKKGVTNSTSIKELLDEAGYTGGQTQVKEYISSHLNLVPAKRQIVAPQGGRGRRYTSEPDLQSSLLCDDLPSLRRTVHRVLPECQAGKSLYRNAPYIPANGHSPACTDGQHEERYDRKRYGWKACLEQGIRKLYGDGRIRNPALQAAASFHQRCCRASGSIRKKQLHGRPYIWKHHGS